MIFQIVSSRNTKNIIAASNFQIKMVLMRIFSAVGVFQVLTCGSIAKIIKRFPARPKFEKFEKISKIGENMKIIINFCAAVLLILFTIGIIYLNYSVYHVF